MRRVVSGLLGLCLLALLVVFAGGAGGAQTNTQDGENNSSTRQSGSGNVGNAITGQVVSVASGGGSSVNATNNTDNSNATTGDATARNHAKTFAGQNISDIHPSSPSKAPVVLTNKQTDDNRTSVSQSANASTGDGIAGQVIGVVTSGGPSSIVASNTTTNSNATTGDATASNSANAFTGLNISGISNFDSVTGCTGDCDATPTALATLTATNNQTGDNRTRARQSSHATSGDGIIGQVIGAVTAGGSSSIDATNRSENSTVNTGDAHATNSGTLFTGLNISDLSNTATAVGCAPTSPEGCDATPTVIVAATATNTQVGDNNGSASQHASASTGDGVAGQVIGAVTSGGSSEIVASNTSRDVDVSTGDATASNSLTAFVGENISDMSNTATIIGCTAFCFDTGTVVATLTAINDQTGDNTNRSSQSANAHSGDGVAGQVIGAVTSGGGSRIDARNLSDNVTVDTGDASATNSTNAFVGANISDLTNLATVTACTIDECGGLATVTAVLAATNNQTGDNRNSASQAANASSGDGVAGQVIGALTSGGSSEIVASNTSRDASVFTGNANASNSVTSFVGLNIDELSNTATANCGDCDVVATPTAVLNATNTQTGDNANRTSQAASASSGDGVAGQVIGAVTSGGNSRVDARNVSQNVDVATGDGSATNSKNSFTGLHLGDLSNTATVCLACGVFGTPVFILTPANNQTGANSNSTGQSASASSGDGVGGQVVGAVTSTGGRTTVTLSNTSTGANVDSGNSTENSSDNSFVGLSFSSLSIV